MIQITMCRSVPLSTYWKYIRASGTWLMLLGVVGGQIAFNLVQGVSNWWLGYWYVLLYGCTV